MTIHVYHSLHYTHIRLHHYEHLLSQGASKGEGSGFDTPSKLLPTSSSSSLSSRGVIPVVRSALDVISDLHQAIPQIR